MVSYEEIREWAKKHYPKYADNIEAMRILYEKLHGKKITEFREGDETTIIGEIKEVKEISWTGCKEHRRKNCDCSEKKKFRMMKYKVADSTGEIYVSDFKVEEIFSRGSVVKIEGKVKKWRDQLEMVGYNFERLEKR